MKITEHQLRRVIRKSLNEAGRPTIGAVLDAIEALQGAETTAAKKAKLKAVAKKVGWEAIKFVPVLAGLPAFGQLISNAKRAGDVYKLARNVPDVQVAKDDVVLDMLDIDDQYQLMLDDALEAKFDEEAIEKLNSLPRDALLPDMTAELERWVKDEYQRGIEGAVTENRMRVTEHQLRRIIREAVASWKRTPGSTGRRRSKGEKEFTLRVQQEEVMDFVVLAYDEQQARDDLELFLNQGMPMEELRAGKWHSIQLLDKFDWDARITKSGAGTDYSRDRMGWEMKDEQLTETIEKLANGKFRLYSKKKDPKTGERKNLGTYDSREAAEDREQQVNYFKHKD